MTEKKYTNHLGLTQQSEEDFVDGEEIRRSFQVLDEEVYKSSKGVGDLQQEVYQKVSSIEQRSIGNVPIFSIAYGNGEWIALTGNSNYFVSTDGQSWTEKTEDMLIGVKQIIAMKDGTFNWYFAAAKETGYILSFQYETWIKHQVDLVGKFEKITKTESDFYGEILHDGLSLFSYQAKQLFTRNGNFNGDDIFTDVTTGTGYLYACTKKTIYKVMDAGFNDNKFETLREVGESYIAIINKDGKIISVTNMGEILISEDEGTTWDKVFQAESSEKGNLAYASGLFCLQTEHKIYTSCDGRYWTQVYSTDNKLYDLKAIEGELVACGDPGMLVLSVEKTLREQVNQLNADLHNVTADFDTYINTHTIQRIGMRKYTIGTDYSIPASDITRMALLVPTYGSINSFIYNTQIFIVDKYKTTVNIGAMFKNDGTAVSSGQMDAELILFPLE